VLGWVLDCDGCGRPGDVVLTQDAATGELVDGEGVRAPEFVCAACGNGDLTPALVERTRTFARPVVVPLVAAA
jgi:hypothetical protein